MARLLILLFVSLFPFSSYSSDYIQTQWFKQCAIYHETGTELFLERVSSIEECLPFLPKSDRYPVCLSGSVYLASGVYACTHKELDWPIKLADLRSYKGCPEGYEKISEYYCEVSSTPEPEPEPHQCPEAGTFYKSLMGGDAIRGFSTCLPSNCVITIQQANLHVCFPEDNGSSQCVWDLFYTGQECTYDSSKPGLKPPEHEWPEKPVEKPEPDAPDITDLPDSGGGGGEGGKDPIYDPEGEEKPDDPVEKPNPDPKPDPDDPDLDKGDNAIVGELSEANQRLENIDTTLEDLTNTTKIAGLLLIGRTQGAF